MLRVVIELKANSNHHGMFDKEQVDLVAKATKGDPAHAKRLERKEKQFFNIVAKHSKGKHEMIYEFCTQRFLLKDGLTYDMTICFMKRLVMPRIE